ncbi:hypothetical protein [Falsiroseomonas sp.]|uniref:hypothetical protein n=1 Tax=Falsiroseomonas sp. TaxID=2870721 RepID=UPI0034A4E701
MSRELSFATRLTGLVATMLLLGCGLVAGLNYLKFERILLDQQARVLEIFSEELGNTVENSLALGVQLGGVPGAQALLERSREAEKLIAGLTISDTGNLVLFDTDRQNIGRRLRQEELAASGLAASWRFRDGPHYGIGTPIINGYGVPEGAILLRYERTAVDERLGAAMLAMVQSIMLAVGICVPAGALALHLVTRRTRRWFAAMEEAMQPGAPDLALTADLQAAIADTDALLAEAEAQLEHIASQLPDPASQRMETAAP